MACPRKTGLGILCLFAILIQGYFCEEGENLVPNEHGSVPEKLVHGEKGTVQYKVNTVKMTGNEHEKMDENKNQRPPWPPRPGRRNIIPLSLRAKKTLPTVIRPGRSIIESLTSKAKRAYQDRLIRPGRDNVPKGPQYLYRPGREDIPEGPQFLLRPGRGDVPEGPQNLLRPGRGDVPEGPQNLLRPGRGDVPEGPQNLIRPGRDAIPQGLFRPGREMAGPPSLFRPGREDVPQNFQFRPGRDEIETGPPSLFRPGREDVPQRLLRPGRDEIPDQYHSVRAGRRSFGYNMPWTYEGSTVNKNVQHHSHTFSQKALEEKTKRNYQDNEQEMSDPNSFQDKQQDF